MKAAVFHALGQPLQVETVDDPTPQAGELVVRVGRCGICGSDLHMTEEPDFAVAPGSVLGHEFAGEIVALGRGVEGFSTGDRVAVSPVRGCGHCAACHAGKPAWCEAMTLQGGGYGEYTIAMPRQCVKLPASTSIADGALVEPLAVALHGVMLSELAPGARVLVLGAGPIGLGAAFWARRLGAGKVVVADLTTLQRDLAHRVGATGFVTVDDDAVARAHAELGGAPDIVFECVGRPGILARAIEHVRPRGTIVMLGLCTAADFLRAVPCGVEGGQDRHLRLLQHARIPGQPRCTRWRSRAGLGDDHANRAAGGHAGDLRGAAQAHASMQGAGRTGTG